MKGKLRAISIQTYGLFNRKGKEIFTFQVLDEEKRIKIDPLQGKKVDYKKNILPLLEE